MSWKINGLWAISAATTLAGCGQREPQVEFVTLPGAAIYAMIAPKGTSADVLLQEAKQRCDGEVLCSVFAWHTRGEALHAATATQLDPRGINFRYMRSQAGYEDARWDCTEFPAKQLTKACL